MSDPADRPLLLLWGFMGAGKSTVGRRVAELAGASFGDLDALIEERAGMDIPRMFADRGEAAFRALERELLRKELTRPLDGARVLALGGGTLVDGSMRRQALARACVITLEARLPTLLRRAAGQATRSEERRPLLVHAEHLWKERASAYRDVHAVIDTEDIETDEVARTVLNQWHG